MGFFLGGGEAIESLVKWNKIGQIAISWVLSPVLGGLISYVIYAQIKKYILNYNEKAQEKLNDLKTRKKQVKAKHKQSLKMLSENERSAIHESWAFDAETTQEKDYERNDLESDYYRELYDLKQEKTAINAGYALENWVPILSAFGGMVIITMLLFKGLKNMHLGLSMIQSGLIIAMVGAGIWMATFTYAKTLKKKNLEKATFLIFSWMQVFTAAGFAFSHGSNDIANAIGPFAAILDVLRTGGISATAPIPQPAMICFGVMLIVGLWFIGKEVIATVGTHLTKMHPSSGFTAELSAASVVMLASILGLPVSSTHILVGAVLGIGLVNRNANWKLMKPIAMAWVITLPVAGVIASVFFILFNKFL